MWKISLKQNVFLGLRNYHSIFPQVNSWPTRLSTFRWILHSSLHRGGPLEVKLDFWNHPLLIFIIPFLAGRFLSAQSAFKNFPNTVTFCKKLNFPNTSSSSDFRPPWNMNSLNLPKYGEEDHCPHYYRCGQHVENVEKVILKMAIIK